MFSRLQLPPPNDHDEKDDSTCEQGGAEDDRAGRLSRGGEDLRGGGGRRSGIGEAGRDEPEAEGDYGEGDDTKEGAHPFPYTITGRG